MASSAATSGSHAHSNVVSTHPSPSARQASSRFSAAGYTDPPPTTETRWRLASVIAISAGLKQKIAITGLCPKCVHEIIACSQHPLRTFPYRWFERSEIRPIACGELRPLSGVELAQALLARRVLDHDYPPRLPIPAGRRPRSRFDHTMQYLVRDRVGTQPSYRTQRAHGLVNSDFSHLGAPCSVDFSLSPNR